MNSDSYELTQDTLAPLNCSDEYDCYEERWEIHRQKWRKTYNPSILAFKSKMDTSIPYLQSNQIEHINSTVKLRYK